MLIPFFTFDQLKATVEENTLIFHCKTTDNYAKHINHVGSSHDLQSFNQGWFPVAKTLRKGDMRCSSQP